MDVWGVDVGPFHTSPTHLVLSPSILRSRCDNRGRHSRPAEPPRRRIAAPPPCRPAPWRRGANPGCTELMRGKAARHSVGAILRRSALTRRGWRHGMGHADGVLRSANLNESIPFGPNNPVTVMRSSFDPMSSAHRRGE